jgi:hypothetical protein
MLVLCVILQPQEEEEKRGFTVTIHFLQETFICE